ncbi:MAG: transporter ATP-binding protein [Firmicutes bacterium]|nr:transporter ATP-binding protein [Bacillota bacterium]
MIEIRGLKKSYGKLEVLKDINITIEDGDIYGLVGRSGAGKSTLLRCINGLETFQEGSLRVNGVDVRALSAREMRNLRRDVGMIFQHFSLVDRKTVYENVAIPMECWNVPKSERDEKVRKLLQVVGLEDKMHVRADQLSGGQMQRVAIARALTMDPKVLLSDEATSALDPRTTKDILTLLRQINADLGITIIIVTHQMSVVRQVCNKMSILESGICKESGSVKEVFQNQSKALENLLGQESPHLPEGVVSVRILTTQEDMDRQIIARISMEVGVPYTLVDGNVTYYRDGLFGTFVICFTADSKERFFQFFKENSVQYQVLQAEKEG